MSNIWKGSWAHSGQTLGQALHEPRAPGLGSHRLERNAVTPFSLLQTLSEPLDCPRACASLGAASGSWASCRVVAGGGRAQWHFEARGAGSWGPGLAGAAPPRPCPQIKDTVLGQGDFLSPLVVQLQAGEADVIGVAPAGEQLELENDWQRGLRRRGQNKERG